MQEYSSSDQQSGDRQDGEQQPDNDPRQIGEQRPSNRAEPRNAETGVPPQEREATLTSAAPDGIEDTPRREQSEEQQRGDQPGEDAPASRVSVIDESPPRPNAP